MAQYNNSVSDVSKELKGSAVCSIAPYTSGTPVWSNVGPVRGLEVKEDMTSVDIEFDNTASRKYVAKQEGTVTFQQMQRLDKDIIQILRAGVDEFTTTAGTLVSGATQVLASGGWSYNGFNVVENQNGDGSALTINSVTGGTDGLLVENTDYFVGVDANGNYGVTIIDSATVTTLSQTMTIDYDYTPSASFKTEIGGASDLPFIMMKFESIKTDADGSQGLHTIIMYRGQQEGGSEWVFARDAAEDPLVANPITYRFYEDPNRISNSKKLIGETTFTI